MLLGLTLPLDRLGRSALVRACTVHVRCSSNLNLTSDPKLNIFLIEKEGRLGRINIIIIIEVAVPNLYLQL